jgi:hypothetical protein
VKSLQRIGATTLRTIDALLQRSTATWLLDPQREQTAPKGILHATKRNATSQNGAKSFHLSQGKLSDDNK